MGKNMTNLAHPSSTGSASKAAKLILPTVAIFFISGYDPLGVASEAPHQHFLSLESVLFNNKSFQTNLHFWISFICIYFLFFRKIFCQPPNQHPRKFAHPPSFQNFKMKNTPYYSPSRLSSEQTQKTRLFGIMIGLTFGVCRDCDFFK